MRRLLFFLYNIYHRRDIIIAMARRELGSRYAGTLGGFLWVVAQPVATVLVFWFVFSVGFKVTGPTGMPFILYFVCGYVPWLFFSEVLAASTNGVIGNAHLVKKIAFPTEIIPITYMVAGLVAHIALIMVAFGIALINGLPPSFHIFQIIYYFIALCVFSLGLSWVLAALNVFHRDIGQGMAVILNLWFWMTPIVWGQNIIPDRYHWLIEINPILYVVDGYRNALVYHEWIFPDLVQSMYFWGIAIGVFGFGGYIFKRLKPEFADVL